ncbi:MAG: phosphocholine cytidylyltransferase family protein [Nitrospinales bacterium]
MQGIILAAGRGSRMDKLTQNNPKCLVQLSGKSLLNWQVESLQSAGISSVAAVCGYMAEKIQLEGLEKFINPRWNETNMVQSLVEAKSLLNTQTCIVSYSDIVYSPNAVSKLVHAEGDIVITYDKNWLELWKMRFEDPLSDAETFQVDENGVLLEIGNKAKSVSEIKGQYMGLLKFTPIGWGRVESYLSELTGHEQDKLDMTSLLKGLIACNTVINTVPIVDSWYEVDTANDLMIYEEFLGKSQSGLWD